MLPGKARAVVEGLDLATMQEIAEQVTQRIGITFECSEKEGSVQVTAVAREPMLQRRKREITR